MLTTFTAKMKHHFAEEIRFLQALKHQPKSVGAVWPTGQIMARSMASVVNPLSPLPVLELGPGTGVITKAILERGLAPEKLHAVEYSAEFARELRLRFPDCNIHQGDAFDLDETLGADADLQFDCAISALPLLNFPLKMRNAFIIDVLMRLTPGRPLIQFSYGPLPPVQAIAGSFTVRHHDYVLRNIPPARIWIYTIA
jgi:phosphatidylethanolamine/phosphatidyl-N-methylethanolamine N-methyltransferase